MNENTFRGNLSINMDILEGTISEQNTLTGRISEEEPVGGVVLNPEKIYGKSAYEVAVANGFVGTEEAWVASLKGEKGDTPQKGVDYFTDGDQDALILRLIERLPIAENVSV